MLDSSTRPTELGDPKPRWRWQLAETGFALTAVSLVSANAICLLIGPQWTIPVGITVLLLLVWCLVGLLICIAALWKAHGSTTFAVLGVILGLWGSIGLVGVIFVFGLRFHS
jgi:hypothetical protein